MTGGGGRFGVRIFSDKVLEIILLDAGWFRTPRWAGSLRRNVGMKADVAGFQGKTITTPRLGPVGGRIVAEVFLGLMFGDQASFLNLEPNWQPPQGPGYALKDFIKYALGL